MRPAVFEPCSFPGYALLDSGEGEKLERFGDYVLVRPDPQALWRRRLTAREWQRADLLFVRESDRGGRWESRGASPPAAGWALAFDDIRFLVRPTPFKHVGLFPEQAPNWRWMQARLEALGPGARVLNLFGYTGVASLLARRAGAEVTHVDASRSSLAWARENAALAGLGEEGLRWVLDDALGYARRAARRGARYTGILLDPPHYGRGPKGEKWQLESGLAPLLEICGELLDEQGFLILSSYAVGYSALAFANLLEDIGRQDLGRADPQPNDPQQADPLRAVPVRAAIEAGELALREEGEGGRLLPCGFAARWSRP